MVFVAIFATVVLLFISFKLFKELKESGKEIKVSEPKEISKGWKSETIKENTIRSDDEQDSTTIVCYDPATGYKLGIKKAWTREQVQKAVEKARKAQTEFAKTGFGERRALLRTILKFVVKKKDVICKVSSRETGKTIIDANFGEIIPTCEKLIWTIQNGEKCLKTENRESGRMSFMQAARLEYHPIGIIGLIVSWNYPFQNVMSPIISALFAGNACVVKVSEHAAWSTPFWQSVIHEALKAHGFSTDLVTLVDGFAEAGQALIDYADKITFIGSPDVGKLVMKAASETLTPVVLELGGKDAAVVFSDCDYKNVLDFCSRACFQNAGQNCAGLERMIVQDTIYERLLKDITAKVQTMKVGPPLEGSPDLGAVTMYTQLKKIQDLVDDAGAKGARLLHGGKVYVDPKFPKGQFFMPTVLADINSEMKVAHEEMFGPVLLIYKFETEEEAIKIANSTEFGLGSAVFSTDYVKAERVSKKLTVGMCNVNGWGVNYLCQSLPFGGIKQSGFDRFAGVEGLRGNCHLRSATTDKFALLGLRTSVPSLLNYPLSDKSSSFQAGLIDTFYAPSISDKVGGIINIIKSLF